jgi:hypothetical protein
METKPKGYTMKSPTIQRNARIVGKNSMSYNDKHKSAPVDMRPIHNAIARLPKKKHQFFERYAPELKMVRKLLGMGSLPRMVIAHKINAIYAS